MNKPTLKVRLVRKDEEQARVPEQQFSDLSERDLEREANKLAKIWRINQRNGKRKVA